MQLTASDVRHHLSVLLLFAIILFPALARGDHGSGVHLDLGLTVPPTSSTGSYTVSWNPGYMMFLQEKVGSGSYRTVYYGSNNSFQFTGKPNGTYTYRVYWLLCFYGCTTFFSEPQSIVVFNDPNVPAPLTGPDNDDDGSFMLNWATIPTATHYKLERRVDGGSWAQILPNPTSTSYSETGRADGRWEYRVSSCDASACSSSTPPKLVVVAHRPGVPGTITGPVDVSLGNPNYTISWPAAIGNVTSYELQESVNGIGNFVTIQNSGTSTRSFSSKPRGTYYYRVRACNTVSGFSSCGDWTPNKVVYVQNYVDMGVESPATSVTGAYVVTWTPDSTADMFLQESVDGGAYKNVHYGTGSSLAVSGRPDGTYRYRIMKISWVWIRGEPIDITTYSRSSTTVVGQIPEPGVESIVVAGNQEYEAGVTKGGNAYVHVPIEAAPGVNGYQPRLTLVYNSGRDRQRINEDLPGDILGYGWSLGGLPAIRRCVKGQDNSNVVDVDTSDYLCLGGEPLRLVSGQYWQPGSEYRTYRESFSKIVMHGTSGAPWFKVYGPDGSVSEYGNTPDSSLIHIDYRIFNGRVFEVPSAPFLWSINRQQDVFGNEIVFEYYEDESAAVRHPAKIRYGNNFDAEIQFEYVGRRDLEPVTMGPATLTQNLLLHTVRAVLDTKTVREYRLISETDPINYWRRLDKIQLCGYDQNGIGHECLAPLDFDWAEPQVPLEGLKTYVERVTDSQGMITEFTQAIITSGSNSFIFSEQPFGSIIPAPNTEEIPANGNGDHGSVVTRVSRSDGLGGWHRTSYAYSDRGRRSTKNWGYLGFYATRVTDEQSGIVTYYQYRLDVPHLGQLSALHQYDAPFGSATELLTRTETDFAVKAGVTPEIVIPYRARTTSMLLEATTPAGTPLGIMEVTAEPTVVGGLITSLTTTSRVAGSFSVSSSGGAFWGDVPTYALGTIDRTVKTTKTYDNRITSLDWLVGFLATYQRNYYDGNEAPANLDQSQDATFTRYASTNHIGSRTHFPNDPNYTLVQTYGYTASGLVESQTTSGDNVAMRVDSALNFIDGRYPTILRNALSHDTNVLFDQRFGVVNSATDPNNRQTTALFDSFGREVRRTSPDGVVTTTEYELCARVSCDAVGTIVPVTRLKTQSVRGAIQVAPTEYMYLDNLGRVIRTEVESFNGVLVRQDTRYDTQGRVDQVSQPYLAETGIAHFVDYDYDIRNRLEMQTRPDGSYTDFEYAVEPGTGVRRTVIDRVLKADGTFLEDQERYEIFDRIGQLVESVDDSDTTDGLAVKTRYTYWGSGNPKTVAVDPEGANLVTSFDFDDGGNRISITGPDIGTIKTKYTALGELREMGYGTAGTQLLTSFSYDLLGRLTTRVDQDDTATWTYDTAEYGVGKLRTRRYGSGFFETLSYDPDSRISGISTQLSAGAHSKTYSHTYDYDASGRLEFVTYPSGIRIEQAYNSFGYVESVTDTSTQTALQTYLELDAFGNVKEEAYGNGVETSRLFDPKTGRLTDINTTINAGSGTVTYQQNGYSWQSNGILESRSKLIGGTTVEESFVYDGLNRLKISTTNLNPTNRVLTTNYDDRGNLLTKTSSVASDIDVSNYQYVPGTNRLQNVTIGGDVYTLTYDAYGNITEYNRSTGDDKFIDWNARNLPSRVTVGTSRNTATPTARDEFEYGPDGQRYYKKTTWQDGQDQWIEFTFYVGAFEERITDLKDTEHRSVLKSRIGQNVLHVKTVDYLNVAESSIEYLHRDHLGSVEAVTDEQGGQLRILAFDPFGERRKDDWTEALSATDLFTLADNQRKSTSRGYTGHEHLDRTGFIHMNGRIYDPQIGRFLSPDPVVQAPSYSQNWNRYAYVLNNPTSFTDPTGYIVSSPMCDGIIIMCANAGNIGSTGSSKTAQTERTTEHIFREVDYYIGVRFTYRRDGWIVIETYLYIEIVEGYFLETEVIDRQVVEPTPADEPMGPSPAGGGFGVGDVVGVAVDFIPIVGDLKGIYEAYKDPTPVNIASAVIGLFGPIGDAIGKSLKAADRISDTADSISDLAKADVPSNVGRKYWNRSTDFQGTRVFQRDDLIDPSRVDDLGRSNMERMRSGLAPIGPDGKPLNLHHMTQSESGSLAEVTATFHQQNSSVIHINPSSMGSGIDRKAFDKFRREYWKSRAGDF